MIRTMKRLFALAVLFGLALSLAVTVPVRPVFATDSDGDGLDSTFETALGTSDSDSDSDDDGWNDFDEVHVHGTCATLQDTDGDATNDPQDTDPLNDGNSQGGEST